MSTQSVCKFIATKIMGWTLVGEPIKEDKCIILGVPHTSIWDYLISVLFYYGIGGKPRIAVKKDAFVWPIGGLMKRFGAIPVDRSRGANFLLQTIETLRHEDKFHLCIAPEGTRKATKKWKGGFHTIARRLNIPVYYGWFDWSRKEIGVGPQVEITEDFQADLKKIKAWYREKGVVGKHPALFNCDD